MTTASGPSTSTRTRQWHSSSLVHSNAHTARTPAGPLGHRLTCSCPCTAAALASCAAVSLCSTRASVPARL
eukprot:10972633-Lingulodinium_polyedra.AAC.1